jgi:uncharacterized cupin superfamily protein
MLPNLFHPFGRLTTREEEVKAGDFLGFPAGTKTAHAFRAGDGPLVYLCGGTRAKADVCSYPELGRKLVVDRTNGLKTWMVNEADIIRR